MVMLPSIVPFIAKIIKCTVFFKSEESIKKICMLGCSMIE